MAIVDYDLTRGKIRGARQEEAGEHERILDSGYPCVRLGRCVTSKARRMGLTSCSCTSREA
eukprot:765800-Hanusia_phi.AAC.7